MELKRAISLAKDIMEDEDILQVDKEIIGTLVKTAELVEAMRGKLQERKRTCKICSGLGWWAEQVGQYEQEQRKCPDCEMGETPKDQEYNQAIDDLYAAFVANLPTVEEMAKEAYRVLNRYRIGRNWDNEPEFIRKNFIADAQAIHSLIIGKITGGEE